MNHPFHPWHGLKFELVDCQRCWGQWRVFYYDAGRGETAYLPAAWTDVGPEDPFVEQSKGRAIARPEDLLALSHLVEQIKANCK